MTHFPIRLSYISLLELIVSTLLRCFSSISRLNFILETVCYPLMKNRVSGAPILLQAPLQQTPLTPGGLGGRVALRQPALLRGELAVASKGIRLSDPGTWQQQQGQRRLTRSGLMEQEGGMGSGASPDRKSVV